RTVMGTSQLVGTNYADLPNDVRPGVSIFIDDGLLELAVERIEGDVIYCRARNAGFLKSRKGLNVPMVELSTPAVTEKDKADIAFARELGVDFFAVSFVRRAEDILEAKKYMGTVPVVAKIEKPHAIEHLDAIADAADAAMVARGDLGVEVGPEKVPMLQKRIIKAMNQRGKPVITATQMLESMVTQPRPTRAEVSDVANAVLDGSDALMLSAESAAGKYPAAAVATMARIISEVEATTPPGMVRGIKTVARGEMGDAIAVAAARAAVDLPLKAVAVFTESGRSAALVSAFRPNAAILGFSRSETVRNRMALLWGVRPVLGTPPLGLDEVVRQVEKACLETGVVAVGEDVAITFGLNDGTPFATNMLKLWRIPAR
ncbi:MAG: pyruvate kinase, partial [Planctomycetia bacterium]